MAGQRDQAPPDRVLTVARADEPDTVFEFPTEGSGRLFGRDAQACDIVVGTASDAPLLSRVAGRIWRMQGELWVRNLSTIHELYVTGPAGPPEPPLPPRRDDPGDPGPARSLPGPSATITAPGGCELHVTQVARARYRQPLARFSAATLNLPPVPDPLRAVAAALCEPLLAGGQLPATYSEVAERAGTGSLKRARTLVGELCAMYTAELPALGDRMRERVDAAPHDRAAAPAARWRVDLRAAARSAGDAGPDPAPDDADGTAGAARCGCRTTTRSPICWCAGTW